MTNESARPAALAAAETLPHDAQGQVCWPGDCVWHDGRWKRVVAISHKGKVCLRRWECTDGRGGRWVPAAEVSHERDSQERIDADVPMMANRIHCMLEDDRPEAAAEVLHGMLRRQRELDKAGEQS